MLDAIGMRRLGASLAAGCLACLGAAGPGSGAAAATGPAPAELSPLVVRIDAGGGTYILYEPVVVTCAVSNRADHAIVADLPTPLIARALRLYVTPRYGEPAAYDPGEGDEAAGNGPRSFPPGPIGTGTILMFQDGRSADLAFPEIGRYVIEGVLAAPGADPAAGPRGRASIEVVKPTWTDWAAIDFLGGVERLKSILGDGPAAHCDRAGADAGDCYRGLEEMVARYPGSAYAPAIAYLLAIAYAREAERVAAADDRPAGAGDIVRRTGELQDRSNRLLAGFLERYPDHALAPEAHRARIVGLLDSRREVEARQALKQFVERYPERLRTSEEFRARLGIDGTASRR
jgi:hypothetical protein